MLPATSTFSRRARQHASLIDNEPDSRDLQADWPLLPVMLTFAAGWLLFSWPWLSGQVIIPWDAKAHFTPQIQFLAQSLARGESPFWLPYAYSGTPQIADPQSMIFSPPFLLLALVNGNPSLTAIDTTVMLALLIAGLGVLMLARDLGWHWAGALIAALVFCFGAAMAWRLQHFGQVLSLSYMPWTLWALRRALIGSSACYGLLAGALGAAIVLGRDQVGLIVVYLLVGYVLSWLAAAPSWSRALATSIKPLAAGVVAGVLIAGLPLILTVLYAATSNRPEIDLIGAGRGSLHPALLITAVVPHLFGAAGEMASYWGPPSFTWTGTDLFIAQNMGQSYLAAVPLLLLVIGVTRGVLWHRDIRFVSVALMLVTLYAVGWFTPFFRLCYELLPGVSLYRRPADALFVMGGLGGLMAGYVAHRICSGTLPKASRLQSGLEMAIPLSAFVIALVLAASFGRTQLATLPLLWAAGWFAAAAVALAVATHVQPIRPMLAALALAIPTAVDLSINNGPNGASALPPAAVEMLQPASESPTLALLKSRIAAATTETMRPRVELAGLGFHWPNASLTHRLDNTAGYNPVFPSAYGRATGIGDTTGLPDQRKFAPAMPSYRSPLADLLGLQFIASGVPLEQIDKRLAGAPLPLLARTGDGYVYENPGALPRVVFATRSLAADFEAINANGTWPDVDFRATVLLDRAAPAGPTRRPGQARIVHYRNTEVTIETESPDGGIVVLHDPWHPWWTATVGGKAADILKANLLFRAVNVPPGRQTVVFRFDPVQGAWRDVMQKLGRT